MGGRNRGFRSAGGQFASARTADAAAAGDMGSRGMGLCEDGQTGYGEKAGVDGARWHFGTIAQEVRDSFASEGLNADDFGLFCYDKWDEQEEIQDSDGKIIQEYRPAGELYGLRYDELFALKLAALDYM